MVINLEKVVEDNKVETALLNDTIKKQNREILRQKTFKILNFSIAIAIPLTYLILHH